MRACIFLFFNLLLLFMCMFSPHVCAGSLGGQKGALDFLELEVQAVMSSTTGVLGSELRSSRIEAGAFNFGASLQPPGSIFNKLPGEAFVAGPKITV